ncbi:MAG TPA: prepilin peptidase [Vicinamibacteria bacterium]|jgi:leader peptidase (prepilin peptidase)/N-methyltransferase
MTSFEGLALVVGLIVGSFANVCVHRLPRGQSIVTPRSRCPACGAGIASFDNVPVLSYLVLRGRCRRCRAPISFRYPAVEAVNGLLYLGLAHAYGPSGRTVAFMAFATAVLVLSLIDLEHQLLHDVITLPGTAAGLLASFLPGSRVSPLESLVAAGGGFLALFAVNAAYRAVRGTDGFGGGDPKMVAMLGAFLGPRETLLALFVASVAGTVVGLALMVFCGRSAQHRLPLGTFLGLGALVSLFAGAPILAWYGGLWRG